MSTSKSRLLTAVAFLTPIQNAMSAAPAAIAKDATIMDWPDSPGGQHKQLRAGTNGWVCYPNSPLEFKGLATEDPMCLDK
jgi:hypothetical protein